MRLSRLAARLLGLAVAALIVLPFAIERIEAFGGDAADRPAFASLENTPSSTSASNPEASSSVITAMPRVRMRAIFGVYDPSTIPRRSSIGTATRPRPAC